MPTRQRTIFVSSTILVLALIGSLVVFGFNVSELSSETPTPAQPNPSEKPVEQFFDILISGGLIVDGSGQEGFQGDIGIIGDRIIAIGDLSNSRAHTVIRADGTVISPGFINTHSHTDEQIFNEPNAKAALMQGITTEIGGQDGRSPIPLESYFERVEEQGTGVNLVMLVGQGSVRQAIMGNDNRPASATELTAMIKLLEQEMQSGGFGLSTGLEYIPGRYTPTEELIALSKVVAEYDGVYVSHMRSEGDRLLEALEETLYIGKEANIPVNISHFKIVFERNWHKADDALALIEDAIAEGQSIIFDVYPYLAPDYATNLSLQQVYRYYAPERLIVKTANNSDYIGKTLADIYEEYGLTGESLLAQDPNIIVVSELVSEELLVRFLQSPHAVVSNDASARPFYQNSYWASRVHPRAYGAFPRVISRYVNEQNALTLEEAIHKMTGKPAEFFGIPERGQIKEGYYADLVIFNQEEIRDTATWWDPQQYPEGIYYVLVNGEIAVSEGQLVEDTLAGRIIRSR